MQWYKYPIDYIETKLKLDLQAGLSEEEVERRRKQFGPNELKTSKAKPIWILFIGQFQDFLVLILLAATLIAGLLGEYIDAMAIMLIVLLNSIIGFFQEHRAEKSLEKLKQLSAPTIRVLRKKEWLTIAAEEAVIGDIVSIRTGDRVPADLRIVQANNLEIEESMLTGESLPVSKTTAAIREEDLAVQEQQNMAFKSTLVRKGKGIGIVVETGMRTEVGKIAKLIDETGSIVTPLEIKLKDLGKVLIYIVFALTAFTVFIGIYHGQLMYEMFLAGVSLAVAVIPEGLPAIVTVALSLGVQRMIKRKAIVRKLSAIETLGSTSVICTDKTGTITENKMTVKKLLIGGQIIELSGDGDHAKGTFSLGDQRLTADQAVLYQFILFGSLCNSASLGLKKGRFVADGDPTDAALLVAARKLKIGHQKTASFKKIYELPFDSTAKRMSVIVEAPSGDAYLIVKGAPEVILARSTHVYDLEGQRLPLNKAELEKQVEQLSQEGLRLIALSMKKLHPKEAIQAKDWHGYEENLNLLGLYALQDPPREHVRQAILECKEAGIKTVMITGDHRNTAIAIGREVGLHEEGDLVLEGAELNRMSTEQLAARVEDVSIFARVTPEHKLKIVQAFQEKGHIVAMTGDGVNDAPAIKASNIGISMGISGTDVTKEASSLILLDDNFNTIKEAIREGRNIYENIRKFIRYLLASNVGEIFVMLVAMLLALPLPLVPVQILWVNLITDGLPAMALGLDPPESNVMKRPPRDPNEGIFSRGLGSKIVTRGLLIGLVSLLGFIIAYQENPEDLTYARTIAFTVLVLAQLIHVFDCRSEGGLLTRNPFSNVYLLFAVLSSFLLLLVVLYVESLQTIFHTRFLGLKDWIFILALSALPTLLFSYPKKKSR